MKIGVIGGGQLGRMLALAGTPLGMNFAFLDPAPDACAAALGEHLRADYSDPDHLRQLADEVDLVTFEFESVPAETVAFLSQFVPVYPSAEALRIARDRWFEKSMLRTWAYRPRPSPISSPRQTWTLPSPASACRPC